MPKLTPTMEEGEIVKWHKKEGDQVKEGDLLFEVATDKATVEYEALDSGFLRKILINEGQDTQVHEPVAIFTVTAGESIEAFKKEDALKEKSLAANGEKEKPAFKEPAATVSIGQVTFTPEPPLTDYKFKFPKAPLEGRGFASPLARKLAREKGVDISTVKGSGPNGRVMSCDLDLAQPDVPINFGRCSLPKFLPGSYEEESLTPMRKAIGGKLQASKTFIPHFYVRQEVNVKPVISVREQLKLSGIKITFNDFIVRATALALKECPTINSGFNSADNKIIRFKTIDIAIAVSVDDGLITPIIRYADYKNLGQISVEVRQLASLAKKGQLTADQYRGGSFTISNLGMFGINDFQAIISPPQASILAVGGIRDQPVVENGKIVPGKTLTLSLSSDHRVIDGADAARFLKTIQKFLESPSVLIV